VRNGPGRVGIADGADRPESSIVPFVGPVREAIGERPVRGPTRDEDERVGIELGGLAHHHVLDPDGSVGRTGHDGERVEVDAHLPQPTVYPSLLHGEFGPR
jgi:hypothetical protein